MKTMSFQLACTCGAVTGMTAPAKPGPDAGVALSAFYTGPLKPGDTSAATGRNTVIIHGSGS